MERAELERVRTADPRGRSSLRAFHVFEFLLTEEHFTSMHFSSAF